MQSKGIYFNDGKNKGKMQVRISVFRFGNKKKRDYKRDTLVMLGLMCGVVFGQLVQQSQLSMEETRTVMAEDTKMIKKVAITFDDGPNPDYTELLLKGLKERGVTATFFLLGKEVEKYPDIVKDIQAEGHLTIRLQSSRWIRRMQPFTRLPGSIQSTSARPLAAGNATWIMRRK